MFSEEWWSSFGFRYDQMLSPRSVTGLLLFLLLTLFLIKVQLYCTGASNVFHITLRTQYLEPFPLFFILLPRTFSSLLVHFVLDLSMRVGGRNGPSDDWRWRSILNPQSASPGKSQTSRYLDWCVKKAEPSSCLFYFKRLILGWRQLCNVSCRWRACARDELSLFFRCFMALWWRGSLEIRERRDNSERGTTRSNGPQEGLEPWAAAVRTKQVFTSWAAGAPRGAVFNAILYFNGAYREHCINELPE